YRTLVPAVGPPPVAAKRGPKTRWSDAEVVVAIRAVLAATSFHGEGYRKVRARLAHRGVAVGGKRVLRLMRIHHLLAPRRLGPPNGDPAHAGTITTTRPDEMWGTDATRFYTERLSCESSGLPWALIAKDGVEDHEQLTHRGRERELAGATGMDEAQVEGRD